MTQAAVDFDAPDLAARVGELTQEELDDLPFGVILLDREGTVMFYSATEARLSSFGGSPLGHDFFAASRCMNTDEFRGRIMRAIAAGPVDLELGWAGDFADPAANLRIRVQSAPTGGVWICIERDEKRPVGVEPTSGYGSRA